MTSKIDSLLSLASRSRSLISGFDMVSAEIKSPKKKVKVVILAADASDNVKKEIYFLTDKYKIKIFEYSNKSELGHLIGKEERSVIGITDENFANGIINLIER